MAKTQTPKPAAGQMGGASTAQQPEQSAGKPAPQQGSGETTTRFTDWASI